MGGQVLAEYALSMTDPDTATLPAAEIFYSLDGNDPMDGGSSLYTAPIALHQSGVVKARIRKSGEWSALLEASFIVGTPPAGLLVVSELHYHPADPTLGEDPTGQWTDDDFEFVELLNTHTGAVELTGLTFSEGIDYSFPVAALGAGERYLIVADLAAFTRRYPSVSTQDIDGVFENNMRFGNKSEVVQLVDVNGSNVISFTYFDSPPWPTAVDGSGPSMVLRLPFSRPDHTLAESWRPSSAMHGAPNVTDDTTYAQWALQQGLLGPEAAWDADPDGDGINNLLSYALGGGLTLNDVAPKYFLREVGGEGLPICVLSASQRRG